MSAPRRWLESNELTAQERQVLRADEARAAPPEAKRMVRAAVAASITAAKAAAAAGGATSAKLGGAAWGSLSFLKALGIGFALSSVVGGALVAYPRRVPTDVPEAVKHAQADSDVRPAQVRVDAAPVASEVPSATRSIDSKEHRTTASRSSSAPLLSLPAPRDSEGQRVALARRLLREHHPAKALETLSALARDEPQGLLAQEREALTLQALSALGDCENARNRAEIFAARYPTSPHRSLVQATVRRCGDSSSGD